MAWTSFDFGGGRGRRWNMGWTQLLCHAFEWESSKCPISHKLWAENVTTTLEFWQFLFLDVVAQIC